MEHNNADADTLPTNFRRICRICAGGGLLCPIIEHPHLAEYLNKYLSIQVLPTDRLPQEICRKCCRCVLAFHQLYDSCAALHDRWLNDVLTNATATAATAHQPNPFACPFCENSSDTPAAIGDQAQLQSHLRDQHFDRIFHCDVCAEVVDLRNLMPHMTEHARHMGNGDVVDVAAKGDPDEGNKPEVTIHRRSNVDEDCDDDSCPSQKGMCTTIIECANNTSSPAVPPADEQVGPTAYAAAAFDCDECTRSFATSCGRLYHQRAVHLPQRPFVCDRCPASFASKRVLMNHVSARHSSERSQQCQHCPKAFKTDSALWMHRKRLHPPSSLSTATFEDSTDIDFGSCDHCGKSFRMRSELVRHLVSHSNVLRYPCPYCSKRFAVRNNLTKHLRTHTTLTKEWSCHICEYAGAQRRYLASHMLSVHQTVLRDQ